MDSVLAVGARTQLSALALSAAGDTLDIDIAWTSSAPHVAAVNVFGLLTANRSGSAVVRAETETASGELLVRVVDADINSVTRTLSDPFLGALVRGLTPPPRAAATGLIHGCTDAAIAGNLLAAQACLSNLEALAAESDRDRPLLAISSLFIRSARRSLAVDP